jgi:hypothetical protein
LIRKSNTHRNGITHPEKDSAFYIQVFQVNSTVTLQKYPLGGAQPIEQLVTVDWWPVFLNQTFIDLVRAWSSSGATNRSLNDMKSLLEV